MKEIIRDNDTIDFLYAKLLCSRIYACYGRVDNGCGAAGLTNNNILPAG